MEYVKSGVDVSNKKQGHIIVMSLLSREDRVRFIEEV